MGINQERDLRNRLGTQEPAVLGRVNEHTKQREYPVIVTRAENSWKPELIHVSSLDELFLESPNFIKFRHFYERSGFKTGGGLRSVALSPEDHLFEIHYEISYPVLIHLLSQTPDGSYGWVKGNLKSRNRALQLR